MSSGHELESKNNKLCTMFEFRNVKKIVNSITGTDMLYCTFKVNTSATSSLSLPDWNYIILYYAYVGITRRVVIKTYTFMFTILLVYSILRMFQRFYWRNCCWQNCITNIFYHILLNYYGLYSWLEDVNPRMKQNVPHVAFILLDTG